MTSSGEASGHEYVDMGLGVKWATCNVGAHGDYWSSSLYPDSPDNAWCVGFYSEDVYRGTCFRYSGYSVRPVTE